LQRTAGKARKSDPRQEFHVTAPEPVFVRKVVAGFGWALRADQPRDLFEGGLGGVAVERDLEFFVDRKVLDRSVVVAGLRPLGDDYLWSYGTRGK